MLIRTVSSSTAYAENADAMVKCNCAANAISVYLSASKSYTQDVTVKKVDTSANTVTIYPSGSETIDGASSTTLTVLNEKKTLVRVESGWTVIDNVTDVGAATATSINGVTITAPAISAVLTIADGKTATFSNSITIAGTDAKTLNIGANNVTLTTTGATGVTLPTTGTLSTLAGTETLTNKTLTTPVIASLHQDAGGTKVMTIPDTASDTLAAIAATQTLTNKTLTSPKINEDVVMSATATELNLIDGSLAGTSVASKALVLGANKETDVLALPVSGLKIGAGAGTAVDRTAAELNLLTQGVAAGYKIARGVVTPTSASHTLVTGLATVVAVIVSHQDTVSLTHMWSSATIGDQAGTPAAGSVIIASKKPTGTGDVTPIDSTTPWGALNWIAIGT